MRNVFELIICACSIVGLLSATHFATLLVRSRVVSALDMTKIGTASVGLSLFTLIALRPTTLLQLWIEIQLPLTIGISSAILLAKQRDRAVAEALDDVLSRLIMRMKEGRSLAVALELVAGETRAMLRPRWLEIARSVSFSPQKSTSSFELKSLKLLEIAREFQRIDALTRSQIGELERWRARVRTERAFRRRSVQAMAQVRAQSIVLLILFALLSIFSVAAFSWKATRGPFLLATPIFAIGLFGIWRGGRKIKWSV